MFRVIPCLPLLGTECLYACLSVCLSVVCAEQPPEATNQASAPKLVH